MQLNLVKKGLIFTLATAHDAHLASSLEGTCFTAKITPPKRTKDQNAIGHVWYAEVAAQLGDMTPLEVKRECKLYHGVPILRAEDAEFRWLYDRCIKDSLTIDEKLLAMDSLPVTSRMGVKQKNLYLKTIQAHYRQADIWLEFPDDQWMHDQAAR